MNNEVRKIAEAAMYCAIVTIIVMINSWMGGILETLTFWLISFPVALYGVRYGIRNNFMCCSAMMLMTMIISPITTWIYLLSAQIIGIVYGEGVRRKANNTILLWVTIGFTFISYLITTVLAASFFGYGVEEDIQLAKLLVSFINNDAIDFSSMIVMAALLFAIIMAITQGFCVHIICNTLFKRLGFEVNNIKRSIDLKLPIYVGIINLCIFLLYFLGNVIKLKHPSFIIIEFGFIIAALISLGYGLIVGWYFAVRYQKRSWVFVLLILCFIPYMNIGLVLFGLWNQFFDMRKGISL